MSSGNIDIDEFENADADEFEERNDTERIVLFLDRNDDRAWKAATVAERLGSETDAVSAIFSTSQVGAARNASSAAAGPAT